MCRLYGFRANEPTKVECTLVHAQNALIVQSREDLAGLGTHMAGVSKLMKTAAACRTARLGCLSRRTLPAGGCANFLTAGACPRAPRNRGNA